MITEDALKAKATLFANRVDVEAPQIVVRAHGAGNLFVRLKGNRLSIESHALEELSEPELDFAIAYAMVRYQYHRFWLFPIWVLPMLFGTILGVLIANTLSQYLVTRFWLGFAIVFGAMALGYLVSEILNAIYVRRHREAVMHEAMALTGNAHAAESYLIRLQAEKGKPGGRRSLSQRQRDELEGQLDALDRVCRRLGLQYRSVTDRA